MTEILAILAAIFWFIIKASWLMLPAYIANPTAGRLCGGTPIDLGKKWKDGRRILATGRLFVDFLEVQLVA